LPTSTSARIDYLVDKQWYAARAQLENLAQLERAALQAVHVESSLKDQLLQRAKNMGESLWSKFEFMPFLAAFLDERTPQVHVLWLHKRPDEETVAGDALTDAAQKYLDSVCQTVTRGENTRTWKQYPDDFLRVVMRTPAAARYIKAHTDELALAKFAESIGNDDLKELARSETEKARREMQAIYSQYETFLNLARGETRATVEQGALVAMRLSSDRRVFEKALATRLRAELNPQTPNGGDGAPAPEQGGVWARIGSFLAPEAARGSGWPLEWQILLWLKQQGLTPDFAPPKVEGSDPTSIPMEAVGQYVDAVFATFHPPGEAGGSTSA
jgi:hypothetical protein